MKKLFALIGLITVIIIVVVTIRYSRTVGFSENYMPEQPIKFSHKVHAGTNQIACLYCHFGAEKGRHAGIPPTELCMNCHTHVKKDSPEIAKVKTALVNGVNIQWQKVNNFPDFAYFNHSQHVKVGKVQCQSCHGDVQNFDKMKQVGNLSMGWCLDCHREKGIAAPADHKSAAGGDCARCHY